MVALPRTLEVVASLVKTAPANAKLNSYVVSVYLAYNYPDNAYKFFSDNRERMAGGQLVSILRSLFDNAFEKKNEERLLAVFTELDNYYTKLSENSPYGLSTHMFYKSRLAQYYLNEKQYEKAVTMCKTDLEWFEKAAKEQIESKYWDNPNIAADTKKSFVFFTIPPAKLNTLQYLATANIQLGNKDGIYTDLEAVVAAVNASDLPKESNGYYQKFYNLYRVYNVLSSVAASAGDTEKIEEFKKLSQENYKLYQDILVERRAAAEAAKKAADEAKK